MPKLILRRKAEIITEFLISKTTVTIGSSDDNDIVINDQPISLRHCEVFEAEGKYFVKDSKSAFGTFINKKRVAQSEIKYGDIINLSNSVYDILFFPSLDELADADGITPRCFLLAIHGKLFGKKFEIKQGETRIGRDEEFNDISISGKLDASVSRRHATLHRDNDEVKITDKRSRNRTFVNQKVVGESETLDVKIGDEILIGHNIFRFVKEGWEDYSAPRKAGIFLDRYKIPALKMLTGLLIAASVIAVFYSFYRIMVINKKPVPLSIKLFGWEPKIEAFDAADFSESKYDVCPSLALGKCGKKTKKVFVVAVQNGSIYLVDAKNGEPVWPKKFCIEGGISGSPTAADVNRDNVDDVVVCGNDSRLYFIDGLKGEMIYKSQIVGGLLSSTPACADINDDGQTDAVCCSEEGVVLFVYNPANSPKEYTTNFSEKIKSSPVIYKDPRTKHMKIAVPLSDGRVYFFDGFDRNYFMLDTAEGINKRKGTSLSSNDIANTPMVADLNGDGSMEIIAASKQNYIASFDVLTTDLQWEYLIPEKVIKNFPERYSSVTAAELNNDDVLDIVVAWPNGRIYAINGITGNLLWKQQTDEWNRFIASPALADINKDGFPDVVIGGENGFMYIFDGCAGSGIQIDRTLLKEKISANPLSTTPVVADIDNDGYLDIVYKNSISKAGMFRTNTRVVSGDIVWAMYQKDAMNSGKLIIRTYMWFFVMLELASFAIIIGVIAAVFLIKRKKGFKRPPVIALKEELTN